MPSVSPKQHRFMAMCKHNPKHARGKCPPPSVSEEFLEADKAKGARRSSPQRTALKQLLSKE